MACVLFTLPEGVFYGHLFPFLKFNDLLRLRHVNKQMKLYSDSYIRNLCMNREIEINDNDHTLGDFLAMDLSPSTIYINNISSGENFFQNAALADFLQFHSSTISSLRVSKFYICNSEDESRFYSALSNLQHLELDTVRLNHDHCVSISGSLRQTNFQFPPTFQNLKSLKLNNIICINADQIKSYIPALLESCPKLEFLRLPRHNGSLAPVEALDWARNYLTMRHQQFPDAPNLKCYDFQHHYQQPVSHAFYQLPILQHQCYEENVKVLNQDAGFLARLCSPGQPDDEEDIDFPTIWRCSTVLSLVNIYRPLFALEMPAMEKLVIPSTSVSSFGRAWRAENIPKWPCLKTLEITIDSVLMEGVRSGGGQIERASTKSFLHFLFGLVQREMLKELCIRYGGEEDGLPCPRAQDIVQTCGNVTKLHLLNWMGTNKAVSQLWAGLLLLEEVRLEDCRKLGNVAFVGENKDEPTFLKLTKLRKFVFGGLDNMPKITDLVFDLVFRHLKLKQFCMRSREPIKSVTISGIRSLLISDFNNHVEIFPFHSWSLENVSEEEFALLKTEFRAAHML